MSTDKILTLIRSHSIQGQYGQMSEWIMNEQTFKNSMFIDELIRNLDIQENSVAILYLLCRQQMNIGTNRNTENRKQMISQIIEFINDCNEDDVKIASNYFASLCHSLTQYLLAENQPLKGLDPLSKAITKVHQTPSQLTSIHTDLCQLALVSKCLNPALVFLDVDITDISRENDCYDVKYFLSYYYYGGIIYSIMQNYERSFFFLHTAVSVTGSAISQITIEAYKKYILVSLLQYGKVMPLVKSVNAYINRSVKPFCGPYNLLAGAYGQNSLETLNEIKDKFQAKFEEDKNFGLVKQVIKSLVKVKMQKLTKTFITLPLKDMATRVNLPSADEAEKKILQMIEDGEIFAMINQKDGMVEFSDNPEKYDSLHMYKMIEEQINNCMLLNEKLKQLDQDIAINPKYIQKTRADGGIDV